MFGQISEDCAGSKRCCSNVEASFGVGVPPKLWVWKGNMSVPSTTWIISYGNVEKQQSSAVLIGKSSTELAQSHPFFKGIFNHQRVFVSTPILPGDVLHQKMHKNRGCPNWRRDKNLSDPILPGQGKSPTMIPLFQVCLRRTPHGTTVDGVMISQQAGKAWLGFVPSHESKLKTWKSVAFLLSEPFRSQRFGGFHTCDVQCTLTWTYDTWKQGQQANSRQTSAAASSTLWLFNIAVEAMAHL